MRIDTNSSSRKSATRVPISPITEGRILPAGDSHVAVISSDASTPGISIFIYSITDGALRLARSFRTDSYWLFAVSRGGGRRSALVGSQSDGSLHVVDLDLLSDLSTWPFVSEATRVAGKYNDMHPMSAAACEGELAAVGSGKSLWLMARGRSPRRVVIGEAVAGAHLDRMRLCVVSWGGGTALLFQGGSLRER